MNRGVGRLQPVAQTEAVLVKAEKFAGLANELQEFPAFLPQSVHERTDVVDGTLEAGAVEVDASAEGRVGSLDGVDVCSEGPGERGGQLVGAAAKLPSGSGRVTPLGQLGTGEQRQNDDGGRGGDQPGVTSPYGPGAYFQSASGTRDISRLDMQALIPSRAAASVISSSR